MQHPIIFLCMLFCIPSVSWAAGGASKPVVLDAIYSLPGMIALGAFAVSYTLVILEEFLHLRKSKPVVFASGIIWILVGIVAAQQNRLPEIEYAAKHLIEEYGELFLFLLVAMTYVNAMQERRIFDALRAWLVNRGMSYRKLFWVTGIIAFFLSPIADNLTTALLMCAVIMAVGKGNKSFVVISCINIVVSANAGGAYSPFGDITTLMVWQKGILPFQDFFHIFFPSLVSYVIPAFVMSLYIPKGGPSALNEKVTLAIGAKSIAVLFLLTIITAISFHNFLHLPPVLGMMMGLSYLKLFGYYIKMKEQRSLNNNPDDGMTNLVPFDIIKKVERAEWDTLLFFYGVILCVGGLATIGYLQALSSTLYNEWTMGFSAIHHQTPANTMMGFISAIIDNIPVMFAVLTMQPEMSQGQWLLVTLTCGIGGSILSVGSAAGVALMGQARGYYTFFSHLKWSPIITVGYFAGILCHVWLNADLFHNAIK